MFAYKKLWIGVLTLIVIAVTFSISRYMTDCSRLGYWYSIGSIMFGELQIGIVMMAALKSDDKSMLFFSGNLFVAIGYFIFSLLGIFLANSSESVLLTVHILVLVITLILHTVFALFSASAKQNMESQNVAMQSKKDFILKLEQFKLRNHKMLSEDSSLEQKISSLLDDARFAPESVAGSEDVDAQLIARIDALFAAKNAEEVCLRADELKSEFLFRREKIKSLR